MNYVDDGVYEWTLARQRIEQQNLKDMEEAERIKQLKLSKSLMGRGNDKMIQELERLSMLRKMQEMSEKAKDEEQQWQQSKEDDQKHVKKEQRQVVEEKRMEMRKRIKERIEQVIEMEEQQALNPEKKKDALLYQVELTGEGETETTPLETEKQMFVEQNVITKNLFK